MSGLEGLNNAKEATECVSGLAGLNARNACVSTFNPDKGHERKLEALSLSDSKIAQSSDKDCRKCEGWLGGGGLPGGGGFDLIEREDVQAGDSQLLE